MLNLVLDVAKRVFTNKKGKGLLSLRDTGEKMNKAYVMALLVRLVVVPLIFVLLAVVVNLVSNWLGIPIDQLLDTGEKIKDTFSPSSTVLTHATLTPLILFVYNGFKRKRKEVFRRKV